MSNKFEKRDNCEYCENPMEAKYRNKRFCSDKCRIYWNREKDAIKLMEESFKESKEEMKKVANDIFEGGLAISKTNLEGKIERIDPISNEGEIVQRIAKIEELLKLPTKFLPPYKRTPLESELNQLKFKLLNSK